MLNRVVNVRPGEVRALLGSFAYFFCLLAAYYLLRPLRDEMGVASGVQNLQLLFTATFFVMLPAVPCYGALVTRLPRRRFIPLVYRFFVANLAIFWLLLTLDVERQWVARVFFVWVSVFVLFAVSVFWSLMADLYQAEQSKRLYGFIAAGGTAGQLAGSLTAFLLSTKLGAVNLLVVAAVLLEIAVFCARRLAVREEPVERQQAVGGGALDGLARVVRSPYLAGILCWVGLLSVLATFLYFLQAEVVARASAAPDERARIFAGVDLSVGVLTLLVQLVATGKLIARFGVGRALALLPLVFAAGFALLAAMPTLAVVIAFQALQRTANFALSNPARESLYTVVGRDEKYKAKNVIDTVGARGADMAGGWLLTALRAIGAEAKVVAISALALAAAALALSITLGRAQARRAIVPPTQ